VVGKLRDAVVNCDVQFSARYDVAYGSALEAYYDNALYKFTFDIDI